MSTTCWNSLGEDCEHTTELPKSYNGAGLRPNSMGKRAPFNCARLMIDEEVDVLRDGLPSSIPDLTVTPAVPADPMPTVPPPQKE